MGRGSIFKMLNFFLSAVNSEIPFSVEISLKIREKKDKIGINILMLREKNSMEKPEKIVHYILIYINI